MAAYRRGVLLPGVLVGVFFLALYLVSGAADLRHNGDTLFRYQTTQSIVEQHHVWIAHPVSNDTRVVPGRGGHLYAFYAPGQAVFMVPLYVIGRAIAHHLHLSYDVTTRYATRTLDLILGALLAVLVFAAALCLGYSIRVAVVLSLVFGLATPAWPDAQSGLEQTQVDLFLLLSALAAWRSVDDESRRKRWLILAGTSAGLMVFTRYDAVVFIPLLSVYPALTRFVRRGARACGADLLVFALTVTPWLLAVLWWNWLRFGSVWTTGLSERTFGEPPLLGLAGLLVSPGKGIVWYMPLVLILPFVVKPYLRRARSFAYFSAALAVTPFLLYANIVYWHGDPAWGPRYLYTALPYLVLPLGEVFTAWRRINPSSRLIVAALLGFGLLLSVSAVSVTQWRFWYRLQALEQQTVNASAWTGEPFHWGSQRYHYYWHPRQSPIILQIDDLYQVLRLDILGSRRFEFRTQPDPFTSNPADNYPINTLNFWWADVRHPLLQEWVRDLIALGLGLIALVSAAALARAVRSGPEATTQLVEASAELKPQQVRVISDSSTI